MKNKPTYIQASDFPSTDIHMVESAGDILKLEAAAQDGDKPALKKFSITAYTGGKMNVGFGMPVVVDLSGMTVSSKSRPILKDHNPGTIVGHTTDIQVTASTIRAGGVISATGSAAEEVTASSANGFPWQASIGASIDRWVEVNANETVSVNGRTLKGPLMVARKSTLKEISFVALGADDNTNARIAAKQSPNSTETITMDFEKWLEAQGLKLADLSDDSITKLKATFTKIGELEASAKPGDAAPSPQTIAANFDAEAEIAKVKAEYKRVAEVQAVAKDHPEILAKAIDGNWDKVRTELEVLRASRPQAPSINVGAGSQKELNSDVLTAAVCIAGNLPKIEDHFDEKTLEAAQKRYKGRIGLQEVFIEAANANGYVGSPSYRRDAKGILQAAFSQNISASQGFSTLSITDILSNTANKFLLTGYNAVESTWRSVAAIATVTDFKQKTSYRLTGDLVYEEVGPGGVIKHGSVADQSFTNQAKTYAKMLAITRQDQINDDLGALTVVPQRLGRGAALNMNKLFWTEFMENAGSFYAAGNNNLVTSNALSIDGLTAAELKFFNQTDPDGQPLGLSPATLLVPNGLNVTASQIMNSTMVNEQAVADSATRVQRPSNNPHAGKFNVVRSSYLSNTSIANASATTWYLVANPAELAPIEVAFLDGVQTPTIETADASFETLGIQMRGYHDFGVEKQDPRAIVQNTA